MNNKKLILEATSVKKSFLDGKLNVEVLKDINLKVYEGQMISIVGTSGEGKSTLLHILGGLDDLTSGDVCICGENINKLSQKNKCVLRNKFIGFIYQFHHLLLEFNILENVAMPLLIRGISPKASKEFASEILSKVNLSHRIKHKIGQISGGERQRVAIARALVTKPKCVLADEPSGNLDNKNARQIFDLMLELNEEFHTSFVIVTHDLSLSSLIKQQLVLREGRLEEFKLN